MRRPDAAERIRDLVISGSAPGLELCMLRKVYGDPPRLSLTEKDIVDFAKTAALAKRTSFVCGHPFLAFVGRNAGVQCTSCGTAWARRRKRGVSRLVRQ